MSNAASRPTAEQLRAELRRLDRKRGASAFVKVLLAILALLIVAGVLVTVLLPGYVIYGDSMAPALNEGDIVLCLPNATLRSEDIIAFRYGERILIKRVIGRPGDTVEITPEGNVLLNGVLLPEPYCSSPAQGATDFEYPLTVPARCYFVLGDRRGSSVDSRNSILGFIHEDQIIGRIVAVIWPLNKFSINR